MEYGKVVPATFITRDNRFVATCIVDGEEVKVHVKNTGRCRELLVPKAKVYLEDFDGRMGKRKMRYDLIAVEKQIAVTVVESDLGCQSVGTVKQGARKTQDGGESILVNMDSQAPNKVAEEALKEGRIDLPGLGRLAEVRREFTYGDSRLDFYVRDEGGREGLIEVKGVTLEHEGHASFPDAPTERGTKHIKTLAAARKEGYLVYVLFVVQMRPMSEVRPNDEHDPAFGAALRQAAKEGVTVLAYDCVVAPGSLVLADPVSVQLQP